MPSELEPVFHCNAAAHILGMSSDNLRLLARTGKIACNKRCCCFVFSKDQLDCYRQGVPYQPKGAR